MRPTSILLTCSFLAFIMTSCTKETFDSTCMGFSKSHWGAFTNDSKSHKDLCSCVKTELKTKGVSDKGMEALRQAMSASIVMKNRFESELNKAEKNESLSKEERNSYDLALGSCLQGSSVEEKEVDSMIEQFKALQ